MLFLLVAQVAASSYFVGDVGATWRFESDVGGLHETATVVDVTDGESLVEYRLLDNAGRDLVRWRLDGRGWTEQNDAFGNAPLVVVPAKVHVGQVWTDRYTSVAHEEFVCENRVISTSASVRLTNHRTRKGLLEIENHCDGSACARRYFYAPHQGRIASQAVCDDAIALERSLVDYKLAR